MPARLGAIGLGVSNLEKSVEFYTKVLSLGLEPTQFFDVEHYRETVIAFPRGPKPTGSSIILMEYKNGHKPVKQQGKLVFYVDDVSAVINRCKRYGCEVFLDLGAGEGWVKDIGMIRDPDGFILEFMPLAMLKASASLGEKSKM
jgi:lactoylglutathione lyase